MRKKKFSRLSLNFVIAFSIALLILALSNTKTYRILELKALDLRFALRDAQRVHTPIIHIDIDDSSLSEVGRWPWPRAYHAKLIDTLTECGARQIIFDVLFTERQEDRPQDDILVSQAISRSGRTYMPFYFVKDEADISPQIRRLLLEDITISPEDAAEILGQQVSQLKEKLLSAKRYIMNQTVKEVLEKEPQISAEGLLKGIEESKGWFLFSAYETYLTERLEREKEIKFVADKFGINYPNPESLEIREYQDFTPPIREYSAGLKGSGSINAEPDVDGTMRRAPLFSKYGGKIFPHIALSAVMDLVEVGDGDMRIEDDFVILKDAHIGESVVKDIRIPVDEDGDMLVNWAGGWKKAFEHISYHAMLGLEEIREKLNERLRSSGEGEPRDEELQAIEYLKRSEAELKERLTEIVKDKICIVGLTATGTQDMNPIPIQTDYPMVGTNSNLINTILSGNFIRSRRFGLNAIIFLLTALVIACACLAKLWKTALLSFSYISGYFVTALLLFDKLGLWIDLVGPIGVVVFSFSGIISYRYFAEEKEKLWIKDAFSLYLSKEVINEMMEDPSKLTLGGSRRRLTALFADVRGFTSFSESHEPEEVVARLNKYLATLADVVFQENGTLDKFVGDELMAFFGAPGDIHATDHAFYAIKAALQMQAKMKKLQEEWIRQGRQPLHVGIGINTGEMVVGNMGSLKRMDYTIIGDNVNLASRLCGAAKGGEVLISDATYQDVKDAVHVEALEPISVKGKAKPITIYRVEGLK